MKIIFNLLVLFIGLNSLHAQTTPPGIPYQAIARNANGTPYVNANLTVRFSLHEQTAAGTVSYSESKSLQTNDLGLFSTTFGSGTPITGTFAAINWAQTTKFLQVEINLGSTWVDMGTQQLMSVPYAMYAGNSGSTSSSSGVRIGYGQSGIWTCPSGISKITVECWGAGGGGGSPGGLNNGGNGGYNRATINVVENQNYAINIGIGGIGTFFAHQYNYAVGNGGAGGSTSFSLIDVLLSAEGGLGGITGAATAASSGVINNWPYPNNIPNVPTAPYIPASFVQNFPFSVALGGQGGGNCTNGNSTPPCYSFLNSGGQPGQSGYCIISY